MHSEVERLAGKGHIGGTLRGTLKGHARPTSRSKGNPWPSSPQWRRSGTGCCAWAGARPGATYLGVDNFVSAQRAGLAEAFAADFAHEWSGSGVYRHVAGEVIVSIKHLWKDTRGPCGASLRESRVSPGRLQLTLPNQHPTSETELFSLCKGLPIPQLTPVLCGR